MTYLILMQEKHVLQLHRNTGFFVLFEFKNYKISNAYVISNFLMTIAWIKINTCTFFIPVGIMQKCDCSFKFFNHNRFLFNRTLTVVVDMLKFLTVRSMAKRCMENPHI